MLRTARIIAGFALFFVTLAIFALAPTTQANQPSLVAPISPEECRARVQDFEQRRDSIADLKQLETFIERESFFDQGECTNFAMSQRDDLSTLNYYQRTCLGSVRWDGGIWPQRIEAIVRTIAGKAQTLQEAFRQDMGREWYWTVSDSPQRGATAHWQGCGGVPGHVAYVVDFDDEWLTVLHDNWPVGEIDGTNGKPQKVKRLSCIRYIHPVAMPPPAPSIVERTHSESFSIRWPLRWISVSSQNRFELFLDNDSNAFLKGAGGNETGRSKWLNPGGHTARIKFWATADASPPRFSQTWWIPGKPSSVFGAEPADDLKIPVEYSLVANPSVAQSGERVTFAFSAREPATHQPITAIQIYLNDKLVTQSNGGVGTWTWQTSNADNGKFRVRLQAQVEGFDRAESKEFSYTVNAPEPAPRGPAVFIAFALPHAQADWRESRVPISFDIAQSALESAWGGSGLATQYNNYFGIKCPGLPAHSNCVTLEGASWRVYGNARESFLDHGRFLRQNSRYQNAFNYTNDSVSFAREVARAGYAGADWESYFNKIKSIMDTYNLYQYDQSGTPPPQPTAPNPPTLTEPRNGATLSPDTEVTLRWNPSANATQYKVELWGGPYSRMIPCDWQSGTSCRIGTMWPGTMQWRVKARNASGQESDWSDTWSFTVRPESTSTPRPTDTPVPTLTPRPTDTPAPSVRDLQVIGTLTLSNTSPQVGETVTAIFKFRNISNRVVNIQRLVVGARGPGARTAPSDGWGAREVDFPARTNIALQPGWEYEYRESRSFDQPGDYFAEPAYLDPALGKWEGIYPYPRVWFNVVSRQIPTTVAPPFPTTPPPSPGRLVIIEGLRVSTTNPQINQSVNARFRIRNDGGSPITARYLGVKGRHSSGASYDFHWIENLTLQPGQEFTYDVNRSFDRTGSYSLTPNWFDGANWRDLTFANGSTNYVTINVAAPAPPTVTPKPPSPGRLVLIEGLTVTPTNPKVNQNVNARFRVKNDGGSPLTLRYFGVKGRHSSGASYDFHWIENLTLQPGQEFTYDVNRTFDRIGLFLLTPNYNDGTNWYDLRWPDGRNSSVTITVSR